MAACVHVCNEFPRGCNNGIFTTFDRRNKSSKQTIPDGNNGNRVESGKTFLSLGVHTFSFSLSLSAGFK